MRSATRLVLSLSAAAALAVSTVGTVAAAPAPASSALVGAQVMGVNHGPAAKPSHRPHSHNNNLSSGGGEIQTTPAVYISWWGPAWTTGFSTGGYTSAQAQTYVEGFFGNVGGSSWNGVVTQYCQGVAAGTQTCTASQGVAFISNPQGQLKGTWNDTTTVPRHIRQSDIAAAAERLAAHFEPLDPNATYLVFTPTGQSMRGFGTQWCAWHSSETTSAGQLAYGYIPYLPDAGAACGENFINSTNTTYGNGYFDGFSVVAGHEYSEAETDPFPSSGWTDSQGSENADKCAWSSGSGNITLGSHYYAVQPTWSNAISGCSMGS